MDFAEAARPAAVVPGRECGTCTLCCKIYTIAELQKPAGRWCTHCDVGHGCRIHAERPRTCCDFFCLWMTDAVLPAEWKPDKAKFAISIFPTTGFLYVQVDPGSPGAWQREPYFSGLKRLAAQLLKSRRHVLVFNGSDATLIMPEGPVRIGPMSPQDGFVVREQYQGGRKSYQVESVPRRLSSTRT